MHVRHKQAMDFGGMKGGGHVVMEHDFCDHNLNNLSWFCHKHVNYAVREAADLLDSELGITDGAESSDGFKNEQAEAKRRKKNRYARLPLFWRSAAYFLYRYLAKGAWLDGKEGFIFTFIQGWWYRTMVDAKVYEIRKQCGDDREKIRRVLREEYNVEI